MMAVCSNRSICFNFGGILDTRENRNTEFKAGQGRYIFDILPTAVDKYCCAFANGEGGTLYLGIRDDGFIMGIQMTLKEEDWVLRTIQKSLNGFLPRTPSHSVRLIPLTSPNGARRINGYKVIEITVQAGALTDIFETKDHQVFIKRDGSVELQNALQIKDLAITKYKQIDPLSPAFLRVDQSQPRNPITISTKITKRLKW